MFSACLVACLALAQQDQDQPTYRLDAKTEVVHGFRSINRTTYTYFWSFKGQERELWRVALDDKYHRHWIGKDGNVWVASERGLMVRPGTFGNTGDPQPDRIWVRSPDARDLAFVNLNRRYRLRQEVPGEQLPKSEIDWDSTGLTDFGPFNSQFKVVYKNFGELRINELRATTNPFQYVVAWNEGSADQSALDRVVFSRNQIRSKPLPVGTNGWEIWSSNSPYVHVLTVYQDDEFERHSNVRYVGRQLKLDHPPTHAFETPAGRVVLLTLESNGFPQVARLQAFYSGGSEIGSVDLRALGGFSSAYEAKRQLDYTNVLTQRGGNWVPLLREGYLYPGSDENLMISDEIGNRYVFRFNGSKAGEPPLVAEKIPAKDFVRVKEWQFIGYSIVSERTWLSSSGEFVLRVRKIVHDTGGTRYRQTLIHVDDRFEDVPHELWTQLSWAEPRDALVTDTGRTVVTLVDRVQYSSGRPIDEIASLHVRDHLGDLTVPLDLRDQKLYGSYDAALAASLEGLSVSYGTQIASEKSAGLAIPQFAQETYSWRLPGDREIAFTLSFVRPGVFAFRWRDD